MKRARFFVGVAVAVVYGVGLLVAVCCSAVPIAEAKPQAGGLAVTYLGNEGFLISAGGRTVLVDALQGEGLNGYLTMPAKQRKAMERAEAPFDAVDLVLATHHHPDHFNVSAVTRFLNANPKATLVSTPEAVRRLSQGTPFGDRLIALEPQVGQPVKRRIGSIEVEAFRLHHGRGREIDNFGYLVTMAGKSWFHVGDAMVTAEEMGVEKLHERDVDLYFVPYWQLLNEDRDARLAAVGAERVVPMHVPAVNAPRSWFDPESDLTGLLQSIRGDGDEIWVPEKIQETNVF